MQIILRGPAAGYEAEHTARLFFPDAEKTENLPQDSDFVLAQSHLCTDTILLRLHGRLSWKIALRPQGADPEYTLCRLLYTLLGEVTGSTPPWGMMTGVRPQAVPRRMRSAHGSLTTLPAHRRNSRWPSSLPTCRSRCWTPLSRWIAASTRASRSARRGAAIAALSPARWGTRRPAPSSSPMWTSSARS